MVRKRNQKPFSLDANFFYGNILVHNKNIAHLITGHPSGLILGYNRHTYGYNAWEERYNYPDVGASFVYQDLKNPHLGENYSLYGHINFFFLDRRFMLRVGQGIAVASNPYNPENNSENNAYGSRLLSSTLFMLNYKQAHIFDKTGLQAGVALIHYSNGNVKSPNSSTNTLALNLGINYALDNEGLPPLVHREKTKVTEPLHFNTVLRGGVNDSDYIGLRQRGFAVFSIFIDKKINAKSTLQAGIDFFLSPFLKDEIEYRHLNFPDDHLTGNEDWKRAGIFLGHELRFNKNALVTQVGYYFYYDYDFGERIYFRGGLKRYFTKNIFGAITLKSHYASAEAVEFGMGYRW